MAIPRRYRDHLTSRADGQMMATIDVDLCVVIYPLPDWEDIERKLMRLPSLNPHSRRLTGLMLGHARDVEMDGHGRVLIPAELREVAGLDKQAMLIGQGNRFELWDEGRWIARRDAWLADSEGNYTNLPQELESLSL